MGYGYRILPTKLTSVPLERIYNKHRIDLYLMTVIHTINVPINVSINNVECVSNYYRHKQYRLHFLDSNNQPQSTLLYKNIPEYYNLRCITYQNKKYIANIPLQLWKICNDTK